MRTKPLTKSCLIVFLLSLSAFSGELRLSRFFSNHMVIQRGKPVVIRGWSGKNMEVNVTFGKQSKSVQSNNEGEWDVTLQPLPANAKSQTLTVSTAEELLTIKDVLVGDVYFFGRQTSIDISLGRDKAGEDIARADKANPFLRAISIKMIPAAKPQADLAANMTDGWAVVGTDVALKMSAAAYHLGKELAGDVPVGIIDLNMGPNCAMGWFSRSVLDELANAPKSKVGSTLALIDKLAEIHASGKISHKPLWQGNPLDSALYPAAGYNSVLFPLRGLAFKAILIQLGNDYPYYEYERLEAKENPFDHGGLNYAYAKSYHDTKYFNHTAPVLLPRLPTYWRNHFKDSGLPIAFISVPTSELKILAERNADMRELQRNIASQDERVGLILPGYENVPFSAQPKDEALLARRCEKWVRGTVLQEEGALASGPMLDRIDVSTNTARVHFMPGTASGLKAIGEDIESFEVAEVEGDYVKAKAVIKEETIFLSTDKVANIARVRYNWSRHPKVDLVNAAGLPAFPFASEESPIRDRYMNEEDDLPEEYSLPANQWKNSGVTLISGELQKVGYKNFSGWIGPLGIKVGPYGPNMGVREVKAGSPAEGVIFEGDIIYSANGELLGDDAPRVMSKAVMASEGSALAGKMTIGLRRQGRLHDVVVNLNVMGDYSATAPFDCPKTEKIIADLEAWVVSSYGDTENFLNGDLLFMLGAGSPKHQGFVRSVIASSAKAPSNWHLGYNCMLLSEYYLATGDERVLSAVQKAVGSIEANQIKDPKAGKRRGGWYGRGKDDGRKYPVMDGAGLACMVGLNLAREAGVKVDEASYQLGLEHFLNKGARVGVLIYGDVYRDRPPLLDPEQMEKGELSTENGKLGIASVLFHLAQDYSASHICSLISTYSFNNTFGGHGGNFWNNLWSPLGANMQGDPALRHFMKGHRWYRELNRYYDGSLLVDEKGGAGASTGLAIVAPRKNLRILGAPPSPFGVHAPESLKLALRAYHARDFEDCQEMVSKLLLNPSLNSKNAPTVRRLGEIASTMQAALKLDPDLFNRKAKRINSNQKNNQEEETYQEDIDPKVWTTLVKLQELDKPVKGKENLIYAFGRVPAEEVTPWRIKVLESRTQVPKGWEVTEYDDSSWGKTTLPISWRTYHTALLRTTFEVKDKKDFSGLRFRSWIFRQQDVKIFINGKLVCRVNNILDKTGTIVCDLDNTAMEPIVNGKNTLAIMTRHNWRWGMLKTNVYNNGFDFMLDAKYLKPQK